MSIIGKPQPVVHERERLERGQSAMTIVCLGWRSLIWDQYRAAELPTRGGWHEDGPFLPIEFARVSNNERLTLVITPGAKSVPVLWAELDVDSLDEAIRALCKREGEKSGKSISRKNIGQCPDSHGGLGASEIEKWRAGKRLEHVIWTALPPRSRENDDGDLMKSRVPSCSEAVRHLDRLCDESAARAANYIRKTPCQIQTEYRAALTAALDRRDAHSWTARGAHA